MDWNLLLYAFMIIYAVFIIVILWGIGKSVKVNKFYTFILVLLLIAALLGGWFAFGNTIKELLNIK